MSFLTLSKTATRLPSFYAAANIVKKYKKSSIKFMLILFFKKSLIRSLKTSSNQTAIANPSPPPYEPDNKKTRFKSFDVYRWVIN